MPYNNLYPQSYYNYQQPYQQPIRQVYPEQQYAAAGNSMPQVSYKVQPVASGEEARAIPTAFNGDILIMPDFANGMIYTKALNVQTGSSIFTAYKLAPEEKTVPPADNYNAKAEIERIWEEVAAIRKQINAETPAPAPKAARKKAEEDV